MNDKYNNRIYECRIEQNISQEHLATILNLNNRTILSYYERDMRNIKIPILVKLAIHFNVSIDYLLKHDIYKNHVDYAKSKLGLNQKSITLLSSLKDTKHANLLISQLASKEYK